MSAQCALGALGALGLSVGTWVGWYGPTAPHALFSLAGPFQPWGVAATFPTGPGVIGGDAVGRFLGQVERP